MKRCIWSIHRFDLWIIDTPFSHRPQLKTTFCNKIEKQGGSENVDDVIFNVSEPYNTGYNQNDGIDNSDKNNSQSMNFGLNLIQCVSEITQNS